MPKSLSFRRIYKHELDIFRTTSVVVQIICRKGSKVPASYVPGRLLTQNEDPVENSSNYIYRYIKANWSENDNLEIADVGINRIVKGSLTFPLLYVSLLQECEFVDPYLDSSRFVKKSAVITRDRLFASVELESLTLKNISQIVQ